MKQKRNIITSLVLTAVIMGLLLVPVPQGAEAQTYEVPLNVYDQGSYAVQEYLNADQLKFNIQDNLAMATHHPTGYKGGDIYVIGISTRTGGESGAYMQTWKTGPNAITMKLWRDSGEGFAEYRIGFYRSPNYDISIGGSTAQPDQVEVTRVNRLWTVYSLVSSPTYTYGYGYGNGYGYSGNENYVYQISAIYPTVQYLVHVNYFSEIELTFGTVADQNTQETVNLTDSTTLALSSNKQSANILTVSDSLATSKTTYTPPQPTTPPQHITGVGSSTNQPTEEPEDETNILDQIRNLIFNEIKGIPSPEPHLHAVISPEKLGTYTSVTVSDVGNLRDSFALMGTELTEEQVEFLLAGGAFVAEGITI